jgi:hypothetical protein
VAGQSNIVAILPGRIGHGRSSSTESGARRVTVAQLGELIVDLERLAPRVDWSPRQWGIASTSCQMRFYVLRNTLREVVLSSPAGEESAIRWVLEVDAVRREIERLSDDVAVQFRVLQCWDPSVRERKRDVEILLAHRRELLEVLGLARNLIGQKVSSSREMAVASPYSDLVRTLRSFDRHFRANLESYEEIPRTLDEALANVAENAVNPEELLEELHCLMRTSVFADHSPLRANPSVWDAFKQQHDEFICFYRPARHGLEIYAEVLRAYSRSRLVKKESLQHGYIERICQEKSTQVLTRNRCIESIRHLSDKFSAMITVL